MLNKHLSIFLLLFSFFLSTNSYSQNPFTQLDIDGWEYDRIEMDEFYDLIIESSNKEYLHTPYNKQGLYPIHYYMMSFSYYLAHGDSFSEDDSNIPLNKYYSGLVYLLENGPDLNYIPKGEFIPSPLMFTVNPNYSFSGGELGLAYIKFINYGADFYKQSPDLQLFSDLGPDVKKKYREMFSPLQMIIAFGGAQILLELSEAGIKYDSIPEGWEGTSPMSFALEQIARDEDSPWGGPNSYLQEAYSKTTYFDEAFKMMHQLGGSLNHRIYSQHTSLYEIANYEIAKFMVENGVDLEQPCPVCNHETLLHRISWIESAGKAKLLIDAGANVNAIDDNGKSPLMWALENDNAELAVLLINAGAKTTLADNKGKSIQDYAKKISGLEDTELAILLLLN